MLGTVRNIGHRFKVHNRLIISLEFRNGFSAHLKEITDLLVMRKGISDLDGKTLGGDLLTIILIM